MKHKAHGPPAATESNFIQSPPMAVGDLNLERPPRKQTARIILKKRDSTLSCVFKSHMRCKACRRRPEVDVVDPRPAEPRIGRNARMSVGTRHNGTMPSGSIPDHGDASPSMRASKTSIVSQTAIREIALQPMIPLTVGGSCGSCSVWTEATRHP